MTPIRSREGAALIEEAARERALLAFDFDGTLAPIVEDRCAATMRGSTRALLRMVGILYPCAVLSGRDRADVLPRVARVPLVAVVGNHGGESGDVPLDPRIRRRVRAWSAALRSRLRSVDGIEVEEKVLSVAVHYRRARDDGALRRRLLDAATLPGARVFGGHAALNLAPVGLPTRVDALEALARRHAGGSVMYVGDGVTGDDAFCSRTVTLGVRVGAVATTTGATFCLSGQQDVDDLLRALISACSAAGGVRDRWQAFRGAAKIGGDA